MKIYDLISMCIKNLTRRKVRTLLTVTGVIVGTCAIVVMISIGIGMNEAQQKMLAGMGDLTIIQVYNYGSTETKLNDDTLKKIQSQEGVDIATPLYRPQSLNGQFLAGKKNRYAMESYNIIGVYPEALEKLGYEIKEGVSLSATKEQYPVVMGEKAAYEFYDTKKDWRSNRVDSWPDKNGVIKDPFLNPMEEDMIFKITAEKEGAKDKEFKTNVVGILKEDFSKGYETSQGVYMSIDDVKALEKEYRKMSGKATKKDETSYQNVKVKVTDIKYVEAVETYIKDTLGFDTFSMDTIRKPMEKQAKQTQMILGSLGAISLFVAALGITNTMVMSIYERTREIGVMKVLGCYIHDIRTVFLMEAGAIGFMGGVVGIILSFMISWAMNYFGLNLSMGGMGSEMAGNNVSVIPLWLVGFALVFSTCIGLISGFYPANRAVKISALEAIKHD